MSDTTTVEQITRLIMKLSKNEKERGLELDKQLDEIMKELPRVEEAQDLVRLMELKSRAENIKGEWNLIKERNHLLDQMSSLWIKHVQLKRA